MDPSSAQNVEGLQTEASRLQAERDALTSRLPQIQRLINQYAPVSRKFPNEILLKIFHAANDAATSLLVSHVTHQWRQIAIGVPSLWTSINISPRLRPAALKTILLRSRNRLLTIRVAFLYCDWPPYLPAVMNILTAQAARWREVTLELPGWHVQRRIGDILYDLTVPSLTHWTVVMESRNDERQDGDIEYHYLDGHPNGRHINRPPPLTHLKFVDVSPFRGFPPLPNVTTLHLETEHDHLFDNYSQFRRFLSEIPTLVDLVLKGHVVDFHVSQINGRINLPNLRHFIMDGGMRWESDSGVSDAILTALEMPALDSFVMAKSEMENPALLGPKISSIERDKFPCLTSLVVWDFPCHRMKDYLPELPTLSHITLMRSRGHHLFHLLLSKHPYWPNLSEITLGPQGFILTLLDTEEQVDSDLATMEAVYSLIVTRDTSSTCSSIKTLRLDSRVLVKVPSELLGRLRDHVEVVDIGELTPIDWDQYWTSA